MFFVSGLRDISKTEDELIEEVSKSVDLAVSGLDALVLVVRVDKFTRDELEVLCALEAMFGGNHLEKYLIVVFTHGDDVENEKKSLDTLLTEAPKELTVIK